MPKVIQVIESEVKRGNGREEICRMVPQYHTLGGELLAERDPCQFEELKGAWGGYVDFLREKYPPKEGEEFKLTCFHHQKIDKILRGIS